MRICAKYFVSKSIFGGNGLTWKNCVSHEQAFFKLSGEWDGGREPEWCCLNIKEPRRLHPSAEYDLNPFVFMSQGGTI